MTKQELHSFACFIREYNDMSLDCEVIKMRHGIDPYKLNHRQAVDAYVKYHKIKLEPEIKKNK